VPTNTPNYGLAKPVDTDSANIDVINANMDVIDTQMKTIYDKANSAIQNTNGSVTDANIGSRTIDDTVVAADGTDMPTRLWSKLGNMIKRITGEDRWYTAPARTIKQLYADLTGHTSAGTAHGSTAAATAGTIMQRDGNGQASVGAPTAATHIARKQDVDAVSSAAASAQGTASSALTRANATLPKDGSEAMTGKLDNGPYAFVTNDSTSEQAVFGAKTANGGGKRLRLEAHPDHLKVGPDSGTQYTVWSSGNINPVSKNGDTIKFLDIAKDDGDAILTVEDKSAPNTAFRVKRIYSSKNVNGGNDWLFRQLRPSDGAIEDFYLQSGKSGDIWTTGMLRWNEAGEYLEINVGGTMRPLSGIKPVQHGTVAAGAGQTDIIINSVDTSKAYPVISSYGAYAPPTGDSGASYTMVYAEIINATTLRVLNDSPAPMKWHIIEHR